MCPFFRCDCYSTVRQYADEYAFTPSAPISLTLTEQKRERFSLSFLLYKRIYMATFCFYTYCTNWKFKIVQLYNSGKSNAKTLTYVTKCGTIYTSKREQFIAAAMGTHRQYSICRCSVRTGFKRFTRLLVIVR